MQGSRTHRLAKNLVGWWVMNEATGRTIYDLSGNGNHGTLEGDTHWVAGKYGSCLSFDGDGDYVDVDNNPYQTSNIFSSGLSFSVWIKSPFAKDNNRRSIVGGGGANHFYSAGGIYVYTGSDYTYAAMEIYRGDYYTASTDGVINLTPDNWYHIVGVYNSLSNQVEIYLNGVNEVNTSVSESGTTYDPDNFYIGRNPRSSFNPTFNGLIDNVMVFDRALSAEEIQALYTDPFQMFEEPARQLYAAGGAAGEPERPQIILIGSLTPLTILTASLAFASCKRKAA